MRWTMVFLAVSLGICVMSVRLLDASAQQFAGPELALDGPGADDQAGGPVAPHAMLGWAHHGAHAELSAGPGTFGLVYDAPDKQLSLADVQKIAEAMLLWHGNHNWRVTNVAIDGDRVLFAIATDQNAVVASFAMNRHTGVMVRLG